MRANDKVMITDISIKYFRSITSMNISVSDLNMLVGLNDVGKSNILKALNLFFMGETDYNEKYSFENDFSKLFPQKSKKAKEITIKITFNVPSNYKGTGKYAWEKRWRREGLVKDEITTIKGEEISPRSRIPNLLRKIVYRYVPAVKSREYYRFLLIELYKAISSAVDSPLVTAAEKFSITLQEYTSALKNLILNNIGMNSELSLPQNFSEIFETLMFQTSTSDSRVIVPLSQRGDGIQARHIPIILKYIADENYKKSNSRGAVKVYTIWGFEEPENGLELLKAFEMADEFLDYSRKVQIFVTTHSPAFYSKKEDNGVKIIYINKNIENDATVALVNPEIKYIDENMVLMPFVTPYIVEKNKQILEIKELLKSEPFLDTPTIMVEGKSDKKYFKMAIRELSPKLFEMLSNGELRVITNEEGAGTTLIKNWVFAWLHSENRSKMLAIFDKDSAGNEAVQELKNSELYNKQSGKTRVKVIQLEPSDNIIELYRAKMLMPFEVEHLLDIKIWEKVIAKKWVQPRTSVELLAAYKKDLPRNKTMDSILDESIANKEIRETIANFNPHKYHKMDICNMVSDIYDRGQEENIFKGFGNTIEKIEKFFVK